MKVPVPMGPLSSPLVLWHRLASFLFKTGMNPVNYDIQISCYWEQFLVDYSDIGYKREGNKLKRLIKTYLLSSEIEKFNRKRLEVVRKKKDFVLLFRFGNQEKNTSKVADFCLLSATFIFTSGKLRRVHVFYRTTEAVTKFLADLVFLNDIFQNILFLDMTNVEVKFFFTKIYIKYFHFLNYVRICKKFNLEDPSNEYEWGKKLIEKTKRGFSPKYCAGKRVAEKFREEMG